MLNLSNEGAQFERRYCSIPPAMGAHLVRYIQITTKVVLPTADKNLVLAKRLFCCWYKRQKGKT